MRPLRTFSRRDLLVSASLAAASGAWLPACRRPATRADVLAALAVDVGRADATAVAACAETLDAALAALLGAPSPGTLALARATWRYALIAWKRAYCFRNGPIVETNALLRVTFWPARVAALDAALRGQAGTIDEAWLDEQGTDVKGLYALESLLFPAGADDAAAAARFAGEAGARLRALVLVLVLGRDIRARAVKVARVFGDGREFATRFAAGGQAALSKLVAQMASTVETIAANRLQVVLDLSRNKLLKPAEIEGGASGSSQAIVQAQMEGIERLYLGAGGPGIGALARAAAPAIDEKLRAALAAARASVQALGAPLEQVVAGNRPALAAAATAVKALELAMKVDLASALGVTLTFQTGDGD